MVQSVEATTKQMSHELMAYVIKKELTDKFGSIGGASAANSMARALELYISARTLERQLADVPEDERPDPSGKKSKAELLKELKAGIVETGYDFNGLNKKFGQYIDGDLTKIGRIISGIAE